MKKVFFTLLAACTLLTSNAFAQDALLASILDIISPVEVSKMIREQGIAYNNGILNKVTNLPNYTSEFKRAANLGVFSTDLGYATINDKSMDALTYMNTVKKLAETMKVGQFINTSKIMQLAANKDDMNKLLQETTSTFENISNHLDKQKKANLAAVMLVGGWLEMFYITCEVAKTKPSAELSDRIVGQNLILVKVLDVLKPYTKDADTKKLAEKLGELSKVLDTYKIEVTASNKEEPKTEIKKDKDGNDILVTVSSESPSKEVNLTAEDIAKIASKVADIRKSIVE